MAPRRAAYMSLRRPPAHLLAKCMPTGAWGGKPENMSAHLHEPSVDIATRLRICVTGGVRTRTISQVSQGPGLGRNHSFLFAHSSSCAPRKLQSIPQRSAGG